MRVPSKSSGKWVSALSTGNGTKPPSAHSEPNRIVRGERREENAALLAELCDTMKFGSLCALGGFVPYPVMSALTYFPEDFGLAAKRASAAT